MAKKDHSEKVALIEQTAKLAHLKAQRAFEEMGLEVTVDQWALLELMQANPECSQRKLAELAGKDPASVTRMLDLLQQKGLVARMSIANNRRQYSLALTRQGSAVLKANASFFRDIHRKAMKGISADEAEALASLLLRIQENLNEE